MDRCEECGEVIRVEFCGCDKRWEHCGCGSTENIEEVCTCHEPRPADEPPDPEALYDEGQQQEAALFPWLDAEDMADGG